MPDLDEDNDLSSMDDSDPPEPLVIWERVCALTVGVICGGAGGYAVFEKSNQAGTAMLLILAAIFLLIGVQGTPLIRFGSSSGSVELERRRKRRVRRAIEQAKEEASAEKAEGIVEGIKLVAPDLLPKSLSTYREYEDDLANAISNMGYNVVRGVRVKGLMADLEITKDGRTVYAELKTYRMSVPSSVIREVIGMATILSVPVLLIASSQLTDSAQTLIEHSPIDFVQWRSQTDDPKLRAALEDLFADAKRNDAGAGEANGNN